MKKFKERTDFNFGKYEIRHLHCKPVPYSRLYLTKSIPLKYVVAALCGIAFAFLTTAFIKNTGAFSFGLSSFLQGIAKLCSFFVYKAGVAQNEAKTIYSLLFWGLILLGNIPLFAFAWFKIGHRFAMLTLTFLISNAASGFLFDLIPGIEWWSLFGETKLWCANDEWCWIDVLQETYHIQILPFSVPESLFKTYSAANYVKPVLLILSTITYAFIASFVFAILFIVGGSTAGTDIVSVYIAGAKKKDVGNLFFALNFVMITLASALGSFTPACLACPKQCTNVCFFFNANWLGTLISMMVFTAIYKQLYPSTRRCKVEVYSKKAKKIRDLLYKNNYIHGSSLTERIGGYSNKKQPMFITICSAIELPMLVNQINMIDRDSTISISRIASLDGPFNLLRPGSN